MSIKISFVIKDPKSCELQPVYAKVKYNGVVSERALPLLVQLVNGKFVEGSNIQQSLNDFRKQIIGDMMA